MGLCAELVKNLKFHVINMEQGQISMGADAVNSLKSSLSTFK